MTYLFIITKLRTFNYKYKYKYVISTAPLTPVVTSSDLIENEN